MNYINPELQQYLLFKNKLTQVVGLSDGPHVHLRSITPNLCPHCQGLIEPEYNSLVIGSPLFQENSKPVPTIPNDAPGTKQ